MNGHGWGWRLKVNTRTKGAFNCSAIGAQAAGVILMRLLFVLPGEALKPGAGWVSLPCCTWLNKTAFNCPAKASKRPALRLTRSAWPKSANSATKKNKPKPRPATKLQPPRLWRCGMGPAKRGAAPTLSARGWAALAFVMGPMAGCWCLWLMVRAGCGMCSASRPAPQPMAGRQNCF